MPGATDNPNLLVGLNQLIKAVNELAATVKSCCDGNRGGYHGTTQGEGTTEGNKSGDYFRDYKCRAANHIVNTFIADIEFAADFNWGGYTIAGAAAAILTTIITPIPGDEAVIILIAIGVSLGLNEYLFLDIASAVRDNKQRLVCAFYESTSVDDAKARAIEVLGQALLGLDEVAFQILDWFGWWNLNILFEESSFVQIADNVSCDTCNPFEVPDPDPDPVPACNCSVPTVYKGVGVEGMPCHWTNEPLEETNGQKSVYIGADTSDTFKEVLFNVEATSGAEYIQEWIVLDAFNLGILYQGATPPPAGTRGKFLNVVSVHNTAGDFVIKVCWEDVDSTAKTIDIGFGAAGECTNGSPFSDFVATGITDSTPFSTTTNLPVCMLGFNELENSSQPEALLRQANLITFDNDYNGELIDRMTITVGWEDLAPATRFNVVVFDSNHVPLAEIDLTNPAVGTENYNSVYEFVWPDVPGWSYIKFELSREPDNTRSHALIRSVVMHYTPGNIP